MMTSMLVSNMKRIEDEFILDAYTKNEVSANRHMSFALLFMAVLLMLGWLGYLTKLFSVSEDTYHMTCIVLPIVAVFLCSPMLFTRSNLLTNKYYKYYVLFLFIAAISILNVVMPKHAVLGWAVCIVVTAHYYNPTVCRIIFVTVIIMMLICLILGTFYGEFDGNLLSGELDEENQTIFSFILPDVYPDTASGRLDYIKALHEAGENRFYKILTNYYLGRVLFITLIYIVTIFLNKRTFNLLNSQIKERSENEKNKTELEVAKDIQINTLPAEKVIEDGVEIIAELKAAKEVGGDLYDYLDIDEHHVAVLIGDVSGKGVPAAMFMMKTITTFRDFATKDKTPTEILKQINTSISQGNKASMFVTCFLAILDKRNGKVVYANAGHNPPIIGSNKNYRYLSCKPGFLLGCFKDISIQDEELTLKPGESLNLYTDGITEARNKDGEFFGEERLINTFNKRDFTCVIELHHSVKDEVASFVKDAPQNDDITFLTLKYQGDKYTYEEQFFSAKKENVLQMLDFIKEFSDKYHIPEDFKNNLVVVGDEIFSNIINYGYENNGGEIFVRVLINMTQKEFVLTIIDRARAFNQLDVNKPMVGSDIKNQKVGGLGILIVKKIMTAYDYERLNNKNILVLKKRFDS